MLQSVVKLFWKFKNCLPLHVHALIIIFFVFSPVVWGECNHSFHNCCMSLWVKQNNRCPLCQQEWVVQRIGKWHHLTTATFQTCALFLTLNTHPGTKELVPLLYSRITIMMPQNKSMTTPADMRAAVLEFIAFKPSGQLLLWNVKDL